jgi:UDP-galactopyranose mutase
MYDYLIVGAGFAGSVLAERLSSISGKKILLVDKRSHIGGNAFDFIDEVGLRINKYGPHIFHTNDIKVFKYLSNFTEWYLYKHKVLAKYKNSFYPIPVNRKTINMFFRKKLKTDVQTKKYLDKLIIKIKNPENSRDVILGRVGEKLYKAFFEKFTKKLWLETPEKLMPDICGRIPVRYDENDVYFNDKYMCMPVNGFTEIFNKMLKNKKIEILLNTDYKNIISAIKFNKLIYTGPPDYYFDYIFGELPYRSIEFRNKIYNVDKYQPSPVVNYVGDEPFYRSTEYKQITFQKSEKTTVSFEYTIPAGEPYYPKLTLESKEIFSKYSSIIKKEKNTIFTGRLAKFRYYNMDQVVAASLKVFKNISEGKI